MILSTPAWLSYEAAATNQASDQSWSTSIARWSSLAPKTPPSCSRRTRVWNFPASPWRQRCSPDPDIVGIQKQWQSGDVDLMLGRWARDQGPGLSKDRSRARERDCLLRMRNWRILACCPRGCQARGWRYEKKREGAHFWGVIICPKIPRGWYRPIRVPGGVLQWAPHPSGSTSHADSACLEDSNAFLDGGWCAVV